MCRKKPNRNGDFQVTTAGMKIQNHLQGEHTDTWMDLNRKSWVFRSRLWLYTTSRPYFWHLPFYTHYTTPCDFVTNGNQQICQKCHLAKRTIHLLVFACKHSSSGGSLICFYCLTVRDDVVTEPDKAFYGGFLLIPHHHRCNHERLQPINLVPCILTVN